MTQIFRILLRSAAILAGYSGAILAAAAVFLIATIGLEAGDLTQSRPAFLFILFTTGAMIGYWAFLPAAAIVVLGEGLRRRDWLFYAIAGGIAALLMVTWRGGETGLLPAAAAAGLAGGWTYWLIAGRSAALWRQAGRPTSPPPSES